MDETDTEQAIRAAREELVRRVLDTEEIQKIPAVQLVGILKTLERVNEQAPPAAVVEIDVVDFVRSLKLPFERQAALLADRMGMTTEQAASLLAIDEEVGDAKAGPGAGGQTQEEASGRQAQAGRAGQDRQGQGAGGTPST